MITFYDIPGTLPGKSFTPNTTKTRLALNFKGIPYRTEYLEAPDIQPLYRRLNLTPKYTYLDGTTPFYCLPIITDDTTGTVVAISDSWDIAVYLDEAYPDAPRLFPKGTKALQASFEQTWMDGFAQSAAPLLIPRMPALLSPVSSEHFIRTVSARFGREIGEYYPQGEVRVQYLKQWEAKLAKVAKVYEKTEGKYLMGEGPVYADLIAASWVRWMRVVGKEEDWETVKC